MCLSCFNTPTRRRGRHGIPGDNDLCKPVPSFSLCLSVTLDSLLPAVPAEVWCFSFPPVSLSLSLSLILRGSNNCISLFSLSLCHIWTGNLVLKNSHVMFLQTQRGDLAVRWGNKLLIALSHPARLPDTFLPTTRPPEITFWREVRFTSGTHLLHIITTSVLNNKCPDSWSQISCVPCLKFDL